MENTIERCCMCDDILTAKEIKMEYTYTDEEDLFCKQCYYNMDPDELYEKEEE